jgi:hypothetical protein
LSARRRGYAGRSHRRGCPDGIEQPSRYLDLVRRDTLLGAVCGILAAQLIKLRPNAGQRPWHQLREETTTFYADWIAPTTGCSSSASQDLFA